MSLLLLAQVQHLFKAGQARAGGRAMILCLAAQLVQGPGRVQGMADLLLPVVQESSQQLGLLETFERWVPCERGCFEGGGGFM
jgi:hypothetical protein